MKVNHEQTKTKIIAICEALREQANNAKAFREESAKVLEDKTFTQEYKEKMLSNLRDGYNANYNTTKTKVVEILGEIEEIELEQEKIFELDIPEFSNTLAAIDAAQGNLPADVINSIKLNFAGYMQALNVIKSAFGRYGVDLEPYGFNEYATSAGFAIEVLKRTTENIEQEEVATVLSLKNLYNDIIAFGKTRGIEFDAEQESFGDIDEDAQDIIARRAMGLSD